MSDHSGTDPEQLTVSSLPIGLERVCSWLDATLPWLWKLIWFEVGVIVGKQTLVSDCQVVLEEIDDVEEPSKVHILLESTDKDRLLSWGVVGLILRDVEVRDFRIAEARVQRYGGQAKLYSVDNGALDLGGDNPVYFARLVHVLVKFGAEDRLNDVNERSSVLTSDKILDELKVQAMNDEVSIVIIHLSGIRLWNVCISSVI